MSIGLAPNTALGLTAHLPRADRQEVIAQAIARAMGAKVEGAHPYVDDVLQNKLNLSTIGEALGFQDRFGARAWTSSDFHIATDNAVRILASETSFASLEHRAFCRMIELPNYRTTDLPRFEGGQLAARAQGAEAPLLGLLAKGESASLANYAAHERVTREAMINAPWDFIGGTVRELVAAGLRRERTEVVTLIESNPTLKDTTAWFDASRGNDLSAVSLDVTALGAAYAAMRSLSANGNTLELRPAVLLVPASLEVHARVLVSSMANGVTSGDPLQNQAGLNPGPVSVFADTRLTKCYLLPAPDQMGVVGVAHLPGQTNPIVATKFDKPTDELLIKGMFDVAATALSPNAIRITLTG